MDDKLGRNMYLKVLTACGIVPLLLLNYAFRHDPVEGHTFRIISIPILVLLALNYLRLVKEEIIMKVIKGVKEAPDPDDA